MNNHNQMTYCPPAGLLFVALPVMSIMAAGATGQAVKATPPDTRSAAQLDTHRVLFQTGFEPGEPLPDLPRHRVVSDLARTGEHALAGEVTGLDQARMLEIPLNVSAGHLVRLSFWVRGDRASACTTFLRVGQQRIRIGQRTLIPVNRWQQVHAYYRVETDTRGVIQIALPSSYGAPAGRAWMDDLLVVQVPDMCRWPKHVEDFPAIACDKAGRLWLAKVVRPIPSRFIQIERIEGGQAATTCTLEPEGLTGVAAPAVAGLDSGCLVAFPAEQHDRWRIAYCFVDDQTSERPTCQFIDCQGSANISPALVAIGSGVWMVWESNAGPVRSIHACRIERSGHGPVQRLSSEQGNSYNPAIVAIEDGLLLAVWDTLHDGGADIYGAWCRNGRWGPPQRITSDARIERHASLAARGNEVWLAWQAQEFSGRSLNTITRQHVVVARLEGDSLHAPHGQFERVSTKDTMMLRPQVAFDRAGRLWLTARQSIGQHGGWRPIAWCYDRRNWSDPEMLMEQPGRWRPVPMAQTPAGLVAVCQYDEIPDSGEGRGDNPDFRSGVAVVPLPDGRASPAQPMKLATLTMPETDFSLARQMNVYSADLPRQHVRHGGRSLKLFFGNLHAHTDLSICGRAWNPPGHDLFANERDITRLDFCALTDHGFDFDRPLWAYNGEQTRNNHDPGRFVTLLGQEWTSSRNPPAPGGIANRYGHRNLIYRDPYHDRFYDSWAGDISPADLWKELGDVEFVCIPHQLADWQGKGKGNPPTDWNYVNEKLQPLAEIFQARGSYEYLGCPRQARQGAPFKGYYLQDAWARGIVIGTIASPDHTGGLGMAGVWAEDLTRESLFSALQARHTFGTSGSKLALFFWAGEAMMGDKVPWPAGPVTFHVKALARREISELVIFRNNEIVHRIEPHSTSLDLDWTDSQPPAAQTAWYYARIHAVDDELAWSSPIWFMP